MEQNYSSKPSTDYSLEEGEKIVLHIKNVVLQQTGSSSVKPIDQNHNRPSLDDKPTVSLKPPPPPPPAVKSLPSSPFQKSPPYRCGLRTQGSLDDSFPHFTEELEVKEASSSARSPPHKMWRMILVTFRLHSDPNAFISSTVENHFSGPFFPSESLQSGDEQQELSGGQEKFVVIGDLQGWGYANCDIRAYLAALEIMQEYYPERLGKVYLVHAPYIFWTAWKMISPFIDNNTKKKVSSSFPETCIVLENQFTCSTS
ncbi:Random slug protein 5 [Nymphaea thermarum]|nr:Random slug protein 5 [Nymphaea thermarum]